MSVGVGLALGAKLKSTDQRCYILVGDGELNEGSIWEAAMFAAHFKLSNLIVIIDENGFQAMGRTDEVMNMGSIKNKFLAFGFDAIEIDGHDETAIDHAYNEMKYRHNDKPKAIVARTIKGKGVSFMENDNIWHYTRLTADSYERAVQEVTSSRS